jgi:hypothetical protein
MTLRDFAWHEKLQYLRALTEKHDPLSMDQANWLIKMVDELLDETVQLKCELSDALQPCEDCKECKDCGSAPFERPCDCPPNTPRR